MITKLVLSAFALTFLSYAPFAASTPPVAQVRDGVRPIPKFEGALVLAGEGKMLPCVPRVFLHLAGGSGASLAIVHSGKSKPDLKTWEREGATSITNVELKALESLREDDALVALSSASGIWLGDGLEEMHEDKLLRALLLGALRRGAVLGGKGPAAEAIVGAFELLPGSIIDTDYKSSRVKTLRKALEDNVGSLGWGIPSKSSLVIHHGRRVGAIGKGDVTVMVGANDGWPERSETIEDIDAFDPGQLAPYGLDLLTWQRMAEVRRHPVPFPPKVAKVPEVPKGTLIMHGGGGVTDETWDRFINAAGGKKAAIVCLPSASAIDPGDEPESYSAENLRERGCKNVTVLHTSDPRTADTDTTFKDLLGEASGVWIDGGRTYRFMDCYQYTVVHDLLFDVLKRDGVVGGSSAGCQVLGDFLVRGNPRTNKEIFEPGYDTGLGLIEGVILDAHFVQRSRQVEFEGLMEQFPQMLGIGVDANTALVVEGFIGEVVGENPVLIYDYFTRKPSGKEGEKGLILEPGSRYDLAERKAK